MSSVHDASALHRIDLNLLVAFDALAKERSVTRAAKRAGVTQSAMSHTLRKLRVLLDDPLLVRGAGGMVLTPRAEALVVPLRSGLKDIERALGAPSVFEPATLRRTFRIVSPDLFDVLVLPRLLSRIREEAPYVDLAILPTWAPTSARIEDRLETAEVDLLIQPTLMDAQVEGPGEVLSAELKQRTLLSDSLRCFLRPGHPATPLRKFSMKSYIGLDHLLVSPSGEGPGVVDHYLEQRGQRRRIALRVPHFSSALTIVAQTELVLTAPSALLTACALGPKVECYPPPLSLPKHAINMVWHPRFSEDLAHRWLRERMVEVTR